MTKTKVVVRDLFTGRFFSQFQLPFPPDRNARDQMWIDGNLLIEPHFFKATNPEHNRIVAYYLDTGREAWSESFDGEGRRELTSIVRYENDHYLILRPRTRSDRQELSGQILKLHTGFGALQPVGTVRLGKRDHPIEIPVKTRFELDYPYVFVRSASPNDLATRIRAVHLPHGERWVHSLPVSEDDLYSRMTLPALSDSTLALVYNEWPGNQSQPGVTRLRLIDRASGLIKETRDLPRNAFPRANQMRFTTLGRALIITGPGQMDVLE